MAVHCCSIDNVSLVIRKAACIAEVAIIVGKNRDQGDRLIVHFRHFSCELIMDKPEATASKSVSFVPLLTRSCGQIDLIARDFDGLAIAAG